MLALRQRAPELRLEVFSRVPEWFFADTLRTPFGYHDCLTDIGMVQRTPLEEDLEETQRRLADFLPFSEKELDALADELKALGCQAVVCDISPLGIAAAQRAELPSILLENFTWDWIYAGYLKEASALAAAIETLAGVFAQATVHIQTEPVCDPRPDADLLAPPLSRPPRVPRAELRKQIGVADDRPVALVTLGGSESYLELGGALQEAGDLFFIVSGGSRQVERLPNQLLLPHHSGYYYPDLVHASDVVVGKPGYSTVAEAYHAGIPFMHLPRARFREYPVLADYIEREVGGQEIHHEDFLRGRWIMAARGLLRRHPRTPRPDVGSSQVVDLIFYTAKAPSTLRS